MTSSSTKVGTDESSRKVRLKCYSFESIRKSTSFYICLYLNNLAHEYILRILSIFEDSVRHRIQQRLIFKGSMFERVLKECLEKSFVGFILEQLSGIFSIFRETYVKRKLIFIFFISFSNNSISRYKLELGTSLGIHLILESSMDIFFFQFVLITES